MSLRDVRAGTLLIAVCVATAAWYAKSPEAVRRHLSLLQMGSEAEKASSFASVRKVCWLPDSRKLLSFVQGDVGLDGPLVMHDLEDPLYRMPIDITGETVTTVALARDGRHLLVATREGRLWWISLESVERRMLIELPTLVAFTALAVSTDGTQLAAACSNGSIYLWGAEHSTPARFTSGLTNRISDVRFSNFGRRLVSAGQDGWLCVWDLPTGKVRQKWKAHHQPAMASAFLSDERLISASLDETIRIWDISTGHEIWRGDFGRFGVNTLAVSADGKSAAWGGHQTRVVVWDVENARRKYEIAVPATIIRDVQFSPDNNSLSIAGNEGMLRVYEVQTGAEVAVLDVGEIM
jgi:WD40 repeat protein